MKRVLFTILATLTLVACEKGSDATKLIELTEGTETSQTIYADETAKPEAIKFKAAADWTVTVNEVTKAEGYWLRVSASEGKAGDITVGLTLDQNSTGKERKAEVHIICGGTTTTITVAQKATNKPGDPNAPKLRYVKKITNKSEGAEHELSFEYDAQMRITKVISNGTYTHGTVTANRNVVSNCSYKDNVITMKTTETLDANPRRNTEANVTLNPDGTAKQTVTVIEEYDNNPSQSGYVINHRPELLSLNTRIAATKTSVSEKFKEVRYYTYDSNGYIVNIKSHEEDLNGTPLPDTTPTVFTLSWDNGNLITVDGELNSLQLKDALSYSNIEQKPTNMDFVNLFVSGEAHSFAINDAAGVLGHIGKHSKLLNITHTSTYTNTDNPDNTESKPNIKNYTYTLDKDGYVSGLVIVYPGDPSKPENYNSSTSTIEYL